MSYMVLARKYRPHKFEDMVGQDHVLQALSNALTNDRLHHAYIFAGTRGVGKTTVARIFAKCLNNPSGISPAPDLESEVATAIDNGSFIDLIEVDAASRTKVEQTRELLENVTYPPSQGRFKIYLIDEAHMLSSSSFNALLKTLEEPPGFVKFLFATTEPSKLPITIVSRCLLFNLRVIPEELIEGQLKKVLEQEGIKADKAAIHLLAKAGKGSLRDALSITDQAIAHTNGELGSEDIARFLGMLDFTRLDQLLEAVLNKDITQLIHLARDIQKFGPDYDNLIEQMLQRLQLASLVQVSIDPMQAEIVKRLAEELSPEVVQLYYQILLRGKTELAMLQNKAMGFEMLIMRLVTFTPARTTEQVELAISGNKKEQKKDVEAKVPEAATAEPEVKASTTTEPGTFFSLPKDNEQWVNLFKTLDLQGFPKQLVGHSEFSSCDEEGNFVLKLDKKKHSQMNREYQAQIVTSIKQCISDPFTLAFQVVETPLDNSPLMLQKRKESGSDEIREKIEKDEMVRQIQDEFDGRIVNIKTPS